MVNVKVDPACPRDWNDPPLARAPAAPPVAAACRQPAEALDPPACPLKEPVEVGLARAYVPWHRHGDTQTDRQGDRAAVSAVTTSDDLRCIYQQQAGLAININLDKRCRRMVPSEIMMEKDTRRKLLPNTCCCRA